MQRSEEEGSLLGDVRSSHLVGIWANFWVLFLFFLVDPAAATSPNPQRKAHQHTMEKEAFKDIPLMRSGSFFFWGGGWGGGDSFVPPCPSSGRNDRNFGQQFLVHPLFGGGGGESSYTTTTTTPKKLRACSGIARFITSSYINESPPQKKSFFGRALERFPVSGSLFGGLFMVDDDQSLLGPSARMRVGGHHAVLGCQEVERAHSIENK